MSQNSNNSSSGLPPPQVNGYTAGAQNANQNALMAQQSQSAYQNQVNNMKGGIRNSGKRGGSSASGSGSGSGSYTTTIPPLSSNYQETAGGTNSISSLNQSIGTTFLQGQQNASNDSAVGNSYQNSALYKGGRRRSFRRHSIRRRRSSKRSLKNNVKNRFSRRLPSSKQITNFLRTTWKKKRGIIKIKTPHFFDKKKGALQVQWKL
jgi:hypothetical protein